MALLGPALVPSLVVYLLPQHALGVGGRGAGRDVGVLSNVSARLVDRMRQLVTFPGRAGDLLWALPSIRALSETLGEPVDLRIAGEFASLVPLLHRQPYLGAVWADPAWALTPPDEWRAPNCPVDTIHLGYRGWPQLPLPFCTYKELQQAWGVQGTGQYLRPLDLARPWITTTPLGPSFYVEGWTECHFELKLGLSEILWRRFRGGRFPLAGAAAWGTDAHCPINISTGDRWQVEGWQRGHDWESAARWIAGAQVFLGDCSALHVLAVALGVPVVLCEPMAARHNPLFYPLGTDTDRVRLVRGNDGLPTCDARHIGDAVLAMTTREAVPA